MKSIGILGAGELGATLARLLAESEIARRVVLVDADLGKARGKALDLLQSGPVEGYDTGIDGALAIEAGSAFDVLVVADPPELQDAGPDAARLYAAAIAPCVGKGVLMVAGAHGPAIVEAAAEAGLPRARVFGTVPLAWAAALRRHLAEELKTSANAVSLTVLGLPPAHLIVPRSTVTIGGLPVDAISALGLRRSLEGVRRRRLGPVALAAAAVHVLRALAARSRAVLPLYVRLDREYAHRGLALAVPTRLAAGQVDSVIEMPLEPVDRVAFDTAAERRFEGREGDER